MDLLQDTTPARDSGPQCTADSARWTGLLPGESVETSSAVTAAKSPGAESAAPENGALAGIQRQLGVKDDGRAGPLLLITAGLHGNEPGGIVAVQDVLAALEGTPTAGRIVALAGHLAGLRSGVRHMGQDLNRLWTEDHIRALAHRAPEEDSPDEAELRALFSIIEAERDAARARGREIILLDLHSTSADGGAFSVVPDSIPSRRLARDIGLPVVLGLEERISGPLLTWLVAQGDVSTVIEGGQHEAASTRDVLRGAIWVALDHAGVLPEGDSRVGQARAAMGAAAAGVPPVLDLVYAHVIDSGDGFVMEPGWCNFMRVPEGQALALQRGEVVQAPIGGYMLMPLYQGLGTEGFFLCRPVSARWLFASRLLRRSWAERLLRILPGVRSLDLRSGTVVARRGAPAWVMRTLHFFGYRKNAPAGDTTTWTRRPQGRAR